MGDAYLYDAVRTPFGRYGGGLAAVRPDDLAAHVVRALAERHDLERLDEVYFGDANQAGEDNRNVARMAVLLAGLPTSIHRPSTRRTSAAPTRRARTTATSPAWPCCSPACRPRSPGPR